MSDIAMRPLSAQGRNFAIDFLRGLAVLAVIQTHAGFHFMFPESYRATAIKILGNGYYGVIVFFTISGFLITSRSIARYGQLSSLDLREFYVMRFARIMPPLFLAIAALWMLYLLGIQSFVPNDPNMLWRATYAALTFQYNQIFGTVDVDGMRSWSVLWSLSIEEVFYLVFPLICLFTRRTLIFCGVMTALIIIGLVVRTDTGQIFTWWGCADALAIGCLTAVITSEFRDVAFSASSLSAMKLAGLLIVCAIYVETLAGTHPKFTMTGIASGSALYLSASARQPTLYFSRILAPVALCGALSYELYLFHRTAVYLFQFRIVDFVSKHAPQSTVVWISGALFYAAIILIAAVIARFYSEPLNRLIRRFYIETAKIPSAAAIAAVRGAPRMAINAGQPT
jgi:peptidoglycan/LPS O-acetylase OafA/YrhL